MKVAAIIPAAGAGRRMKKAQPKPFLDLLGRPILGHTLDAFQRSRSVDEIALVVPGEYIPFCWEKIVRPYGFSKVREIIHGGSERQDSVYEGLKVLRGSMDIALIHDAVRPFIQPDQIDEAVALCRRTRAVIVAVPVKDTVKVGKDSKVVRTLDRGRLWAAQTPQVFRSDLIQNAYEAAFRESVYGTDDAFLVERLGHPVHILEGSHENIKITTPEDLYTAEAILRRRTGNPWEDIQVRIGQGYDVHRLIEERKLILGGVEIPFQKGLLGHSDADVLCHALSDALLGGAAMGDIGRHFPDTDPQFKGIYSLVLLRHVADLLRKAGTEVINVDATVLAEAPKLAPFISQMRRNIAEILSIKEGDVSIKATTSEGLGPVGRGEGIAAHAVALIKLS